MKSKIINQFQTLNELNQTLKEGCKLCELGSQPGIDSCRSRGSGPNMIVGEGPGFIENQTGVVFTGPAGILLDDIWKSVGMDTNDFYLTNTIRCRPVAPEYSGKQNLEPTLEQKQTCWFYLSEEIRLLNPRLIVTLGKHATQSFIRVKTMGEVRGRVFTINLLGQERLIFPMYHPAAILHAKHKTEVYDDYRTKTWQDVQKLKELINGR